MKWTKDNYCACGRSFVVLETVREAKDPIVQSEILRRAQIVLTDFVFGLNRLPDDQTSSAVLRGSRGQKVKFDA